MLNVPLRSRCRSRSRGPRDCNVSTVCWRRRVVLNSFWYILLISYIWGLDYSVVQ